MRRDYHRGQFSNSSINMVRADDQGNNSYTHQKDVPSMIGFKTQCVVLADGGLVSYRRPSKKQNRKKNKDHPMKDLEY